MIQISAGKIMQQYIFQSTSELYDKKKLLFFLIVSYDDIGWASDLTCKFNKNDFLCVKFISTYESL